MNSGPVSERVYDALRRRVVGSAFRPGDRLDAGALGDLLGSSVTPVRDALHVLVGEGLVETRTSEGFHVPGIDAPALEDLYGWNAQVLGLALKSAGSPLLLPAAVDNYAERVADLFAALAAASVNAEHARAVRAINDRLHAARMVEPGVLTGVDAEVDALAAAAAGREMRALRSLLADYHRRRARRAADLVRALYRAR